MSKELFILQVVLLAVQLVCLLYALLKLRQSRKPEKLTDDISSIQY